MNQSIKAEIKDGTLFICWKRGDEDVRYKIPLGAEDTENMLDLALYGMTGAYYAKGVADGRREAFAELRKLIGVEP